MRFKYTSKAFTLVELMVTVAIIGILSAVVLANLNTAKSKSRDSKRITDLGQLQIALEKYYDKCKMYPSDLSSSSYCVNSAGGPNITLTTFIAKIPSAPNPGNYEYKSSENGQDYLLKTVLENNNSVLTDSFHNDSTTVIGVNCTDDLLAYCVQPR